MCKVPFFSIIVPVYNVEKYLGQCIRSVLQQKNSNYEMVLVDDGSTDTSGMICETYKTQVPGKIKVIHQKNGGPSKARNTGITHAKGTYIVFLDSDDYLLDDSILNRIEDKAQGQDMIAFEWKDVLEGIEAPAAKIHYREKNIGNKLDGKSFLEKMLTTHPEMPWYACMYAYKCDYIQEYNLRFQEGHTYEDILLTPRALLSAKSVGILPYPVYGYRIGRAASITSTVTYKTLQDHLYASHYNANLLKDNPNISNDLKNKMLSNFAAEYFSVMINVYALPTKKDRLKIIALLKLHRNIAQYAYGKKQVGARMIMNTFGIMPAIWVLNMRRVIKGMLKK